MIISLKEEGANSLANGLVICSGSDSSSTFAFPLSSEGRLRSVDVALSERQYYIFQSVLQFWRCHLSSLALLTCRVITAIDLGNRLVPIF